MKEKNYNYCSDIKNQTNKEKLDKAVKHWKRNLIGIILSSILFLALIVSIINGMKFTTNFPIIGVVVSLTGFFFFSRELKIIPKGQLVSTGLKAILCWFFALIYFFQYNSISSIDDIMLFIALIGVPLLDLPKVIQAYKIIKQSNE